MEPGLDGDKVPAHKLKTDNVSLPLFPFSHPPFFVPVAHSLHHSSWRRNLCKTIAIRTGHGPSSLVSRPVRLVDASVHSEKPLSGSFGSGNCLQHNLPLNVLSPSISLDMTMTPCPLLPLPLPQCDDDGNAFLSIGATLMSLLPLPFPPNATTTAMRPHPHPFPRMMMMTHHHPRRRPSRRGMSWVYRRMIGFLGNTR
jgi:hypothetical protein